MGAICCRASDVGGFGSPERTPHAVLREGQVEIPVFDDLPYLTPGQATANQTLDHPSFEINDFSSPQAPPSPRRGWMDHLTPSYVGEKELCALAIAIQNRIDLLAANAAEANAALESARSAAIAQSITRCDDDQSRPSIEVRFEEVKAEISRSEALQRSALEAELVAVDAALEHFQCGDAESSAHTEPILQFGFPPLVPTESGTLRLLPEREERACGLGILCAPRTIQAEDLVICHPSIFSSVRVGRPFRFDVMINGACNASLESMRAASSHLASRLRITAALIPVSNSEDQTQQSPILLQATCTEMMDGVCVRVALPDFIPPPGLEGSWTFRVGRVALGASSVPLGPLLGLDLPLRVRPPAPRQRTTPRDLHAACCRGDLVGVIYALAARGSSTEETDNVSGLVCVCHDIARQASYTLLKHWHNSLQRGLSCILATMQTCEGPHDRVNRAKILAVLIEAGANINAACSPWVSIPSGCPQPGRWIMLLALGRVVLAMLLSSIV